MKKYFLHFNLVFCSLVANSQPISPGGVNGAIKWYIANTNTISPFFESVQPADSAPVFLSNFSNTVHTLNNYPSLVFTGSSKLSISFNGLNLKSGSYFTVYKPFNVSTENILWYLSSSNKTHLVLTTNRMADLNEFNYINYIDKFPLNPKVNTYVQNKTDDSLTYSALTLNMGYKPESPALPISSFKGLIPEIIIYDSVLDWNAQIRVASYLALKYGITLTEPGASYLNSAGDKIWDGESCSNYHNNIAGIARDDASGLYQKIASSSNDPNLLSISTKSSLKDKSFLIWGDNDKPFSAITHTPGTPNILDKKWFIISHGILDSLKVDLVVDTKKIDEPLPPLPVFWLAIDRTGTGNFSQTSTEYIKMSQLDSKQYAHFNKVELNKADGDKSVFGFVVGKELLLSSYIINPTCGNRQSGNIQIKVWGGLPPFQLKILKDDAPFISYQFTNETVNIPTLSAGKYSIEVIDYLQHSYRDNYYINNEDGPHPKEIAERYMLENGNQLQIDASDQMQQGLNYQWLGPNNFHSFTPKITITQSGEYTLTCTRDGCSNVQNVVVSRPSKGIFNSIKIYPNPSTGLFRIKIGLDKVAHLNLNIYSEDGKIVAKKQLEGFANYTLEEELNTPGIYYLVFKSGLSTEAKKLVIAK